MVRVGAERTDTEVLWPPQIVRTPGLVYLDLNQWIALAKAKTGHADGVRWQPALSRLRGCKGGWTFVIGMPLLMELQGIHRRRQRFDIGDVIEEFTQFSCVLPLTTIAAAEFECSLARFAGIRSRHQPIPLLGRGVGRACGMRGGFRVRDADGSDMTAQARRESPVGPEEFDRRLETAERDFDRGVIRGPADDAEERELRSLGWDPMVTRKGAENRARQEAEHAALLDRESHWRRGRLRDVVAARYLALEIEGIVNDALDAHGLSMTAVTPTAVMARVFTDSMPAADVWITLRTAMHRSRDSAWKPNDIFDIDALCVAAPYCDVVVTERHSAHVLKQAGVPRRYETAILTDLDQLAEHLAYPDDRQAQPR